MCLTSIAIQVSSSSSDLTKPIGIEIPPGWLVVCLGLDNIQYCTFVYKASILLNFIFSKNRLNVAISRAKCLSIVVGSPELANCMPKNVEEAKQLSRFCKVLRYMDQD